jgi:thermostable 8-oxoguanine DNA glycosylase
MCLRSRWRNRSADKIIVFGASKITQLGVLRSTHFRKNKSRQVKITTIKELFFCLFDKKMQAKNKIKQNNNKVKYWKRETPLAEIFFLPGNDA